MEDKYLAILKQYWGYQNFRGIQREIIESIGAGRDTLGLMPTGGGKSITFQVPGMAMEGVCLVFTPLIALMKDQVDMLLEKGIRAAAIHAGVSHERIVQILETAIFGGYKFLYIAPERLQSELFLSKLKRIKVNFITVDEAHCICQWGYDFRPAYREIGNIRLLKPHIPILALTATATPDVVKDIQLQLGFECENVFRMSFYRPNLVYRVMKCEHRAEGLTSLLRDIPGSAIVYTRSREKCKLIAQALNKEGFLCTYYHAGLSDEEKNTRQTQWKQNAFRVMVATNAFGMGIDKPDVRLVVHMDLPDSLEAYFQEAGRAGRDGEKSYAIIPMDGQELLSLRRRASQQYPEPSFIRTVYEKLSFYFQIAMGDGFQVTKEFNLQEFCVNFHTHPIATKSALFLLENAGYIQYIDEEESCSRLMFLATRQELYRTINTDMEPVIYSVMRLYEGIFSSYCYIDESRIAQQAQVTESMVYNGLKHLSRCRIVDYVPKKRIARIKYLKSRVETEHIFLPKSVYDERKHSFEQRINAMEQYCLSDECRSTFLLRYFGEKKGSDCMQCDSCEARNSADTTEDEYQQIKQHILSQFIDGRINVFNLQMDSLRVEKYKEVIDCMRESEEILVDGIYLIHRPV